MGKEGRCQADAWSGFEQALRRLQQGEKVEVHVGEELVAHLVPAAPRETLRQWGVDAAIDELALLRRGNRLEGVSLRELIGRGRT